MWTFGIFMGLERFSQEAATFCEKHFSVAIYFLWGGKKKSRAFGVGKGLSVPPGS